MLTSQRKYHHRLLGTSLKIFLIVSLFIFISPLSAHSKEDSLGVLLVSIFEDYKSIEEMFSAEAFSYDGEEDGQAIEDDDLLIDRKKGDVLKTTETLLARAYKKGNNREISELIIFKWTTILKRSTPYNPARFDSERAVLKDLTLKNSPSIEKLITALSFETPQVIFNYSPNIKGPIGNYLTALGHFKKAELKEANEYLSFILPDDDIYRYALLLKAQIYFLENDTAKSINALQDILNSDAKHIIKEKAKLLTGQVYFEAGQYKKARNYFDLIKKESPLYYEAHLASIWAMEKYGDHLSALLLLKELKANKDFAGDPLDLASLEATIYITMKKLDKALEILEIAEINRDNLNKKLLQFTNQNNKTSLRELITTDLNNNYLTTTLREDMSINKELSNVAALKKLKKPYDDKIEELSFKIKAIENSISQKKEFNKSINLEISNLNQKLKIITSQIFTNNKGKIKLKPLSDESRKIEKTISSTWSLTLKRNLTPMEKLFSKILSHDLIESQKCTRPINDCPFYEGIKNKASFNKSIIDKIVRDLFSVAHNKKIIYKAKSKTITKTIDDKIDKESKILKKYEDINKNYALKSAELNDALNKTYLSIDKIIDARLGLIAFELKGTEIKISRAIKIVKEQIKLSREK